MPRDRTRAAYRALLGLYPRSFRERFGEPMEQTFDDLRRERSSAGGGMLGLVVRTFADTSLGIAREHVAALSRAKLARHHRSALVGLLLFLPVGILFPAIWLDIAVVRDLLTADGDQPSALGLTVILGALLLLPVAFVVTLRPMLRSGLSRKPRAYAVNLLVCAVISIPMGATAVGIGAEIYRCEIRGVPNCD
ncbi:MAG TPA: hypothetical protein VNO82_23205 [Solirubrobacteraceae bacterium]|nr:hypothetical protein [Solirubrobacteraceae bacterium]